MSMNLHFVDEHGGFQEFPFQTSTKLTYEVMALPSKQAQYEHLCNFLNTYDDDSWTERVMDTIHSCLFQYNYTLAYI